MATVAELQRERKSALREVRRRQRAADTAIEKMERRIYSLLDRKTLITSDDAVRLAERYNEFVRLVRSMESGLSDFLDVVSRTGGFGE